MVRTQISMTQEQAEGLRRLAATRRQSQSSLLRESLDTLLSTADLADLVAAAREVIGRHGSGSSDASVDHDAALDEAFSA